MLTADERRLLTDAADTLDDADAAIRDATALGCDPKAMAAGIRAIVDRPAPTPGLDLDAVERAIDASERAQPGYGVPAVVMPAPTVRALIAEVRALRAVLAEVRDLIGNTEHESTCAIGPYNAEQNGADCSCTVGTISAALEAL